MRRLSRAHRRKHGPKIPMGVVMSYQALWRRWLKHLHVKLLDHLLANYRHQMKGRLSQDAYHPDRPHAGIVTQEVFKDPALTTDIRVLAARVNKQNTIDFRRVVGVNLHTEQGIDSAIEAFRDRNIALFKTLAEDELGPLHDILDEAERGAWRVEELADKLKDQFEVTESKAEFWARDQVLKLNGQLTQQRQTNAGITDYIWTTSGDERVREMHADLEGTRQQWGDPPVTNDNGDTNNPGTDFQCRCTAFPVLDELTDNE